MCPFPHTPGLVCPCTCVFSLLCPRAPSIGRHFCVQTWREAFDGKKHVHATLEQVSSLASKCRALAGPQTCRCESQSSTAGDMQPGVRPSARRAANSCLVWGLGLDLFLFPPVLRLEPGTLDILGFAFCCHFLFVPQGTCLFRSQVSRVLVMTLMLAQERDPLAKCSLGPLHTEHSAT